MIAVPVVRRTIIALMLSLLRMISGVECLKDTSAPDPQRRRRHAQQQRRRGGEVEEGTLHAGSLFQSLPPRTATSPSAAGTFPDPGPRAGVPRRAEAAAGPWVGRSREPEGGGGGKGVG